MFDRLRWNSLTTKIALTVIFASVTAVVVVAALSFQREQASFRNALEQQADSLLAVLVETSDNALFQLDVDTIELLTEGAVETESVEVVRFYDRDGRLIADSGASSTLTFSDVVDPAGLDLLSSETAEFTWGDTSLSAGRRIQLGNQVLGAVSIELSTAILQENIATARSQTIILALTVAVAASVLAVLLSRSIIMPLLRLISAAEKVAKGEYKQQVEIHTRDELETLAHAFNTMTQSIQKNTTELKQARDEAVAAQQLAQESSRLKSEFLSTMSHELRTPLNAIEGFTSIMLSGMGVELSPIAEDMVKRISSNSKRLLNLINDFLDLSRIESGRLELVSDPFSPKELSEKWRSAVGVLAEKKGIEFIVEVDDALPATIYGDEDALSKIAINLLGNAFKFTHEGSVTLRLKRDDNQWLIAVRDTGIGIPPHAREYIFDEFRQVDGSSKREYGGTGLGLSLVQKLSRAMGGGVTLDSEVGKGSTFTVALPLIQQPEEVGVS